MADPRGTAPTWTGLALLPLLLLAACGRPQADLRREGRRQGEARALQTLRADYRLPDPPPFQVQVHQAGKGAPATVRLALAEPGWEAAAPLEPTPVQRRAEGPGTVLTFGLPAGRVAGYDGFPEPAPLLLHLWKGEDHRLVEIPCVASARRPGELAGLVLALPLLVVTAPVWLPSWLILQPVQDADDAKVIARAAAEVAQPGPAAPPSHPPEAARFVLGLVAAGPGTGPSLRIAPGPVPWAAPWGGSALEALREAVACFQPGLAAGVAEDPAQPGAFLVPLGPEPQGARRPLLLLLRTAATGDLQGEVWACYFSAADDWVKAWRLHGGPAVAGGSPGAPSPRAERAP